MNDTLAQFFVLLGGIITVAIVAVLVSQKSQTPSVISSFFSGFSQSIGAAVSPVTGGTVGQASQINSLLGGGGIYNQGI